MIPKITWPDGKRFAFTVLDDTDLVSLENVRDVYRLLCQLGMRTTKSCWMIEGDSTQGKFPGQTCDDAAYCRWLVELQSQGFEIGWHGATWHTVPRETTIAALDRFAATFGRYPRTAANHTGAAQGVYWAESRLTGLHSLLYTVLTRGKNFRKYRGHVETDELFWGDVCRQRLKYYRNFVFQDVNTLNACPQMPYHDPLRPMVNLWFASSNGRDVQTFCRCLSEENQDRLEAEGGACILYAHFAYGFVEDGRVDPRARMLLERLAAKNGWFVPVETLLDHLASQRPSCDITPRERRRLERKWLLEKIRVGTI
jgi:hypothetical protein